MVFKKGHKPQAPSAIKRYISMPPELGAEIRKMRRDHVEFTAYGPTRCKWCPTESRTRYDLSHPKSEFAGAWCSAHGWLSFDSVKVRPIGDEYIPRKRKKAA